MRTGNFSSQHNVQYSVQQNGFRPKIRCAIYTRKSSEDGLEQEFNSIDAQRLSAENYIAAQISKGWVPVEEQYNDGGYSGGTLERPALKRLFQDIQEGKIDCVVIYKIDRLSRSLFDFQKIIELFDQHKVSFASVTQNFTTDDSVGRLMLNIMLSFAQYERELTGERIRDKHSASRKKGMWMGGKPPLGYDVKERKLVINEAEAKIVRILFHSYTETESITETVRDLNKQGFVTKTWIPNSGKLQKGQKFDKKSVRRILENHIYAGKVKHKDQIYDGLHEAIIADDLWQKVKDIFSKNQTNQISIPKTRITAAPLLKGIVSCGGCGNRMVPSYTIKRGKRYRYYLCYSKAIGKNESCAIGRISASEVEGSVINQILGILRRPEFIVETIKQSTDMLNENVVIDSFKQIEKVWDELFPIEQARIISLLVQNITINPSGLNIKIFKDGLRLLSKELTQTIN